MIKEFKPNLFNIICLILTVISLILFFVITSSQIVSIIIFHIGTTCLLMFLFSIYDCDWYKTWKQ